MTPTSAISEIAKWQIEFDSSNDDATISETEEPLPAAPAPAEAYYADSRDLQYMGYTNHGLPKVSKI